MKTSDVLKNSQFEIRLLQSHSVLWEYQLHSADQSFKIASPVFEIDGKEVAISATVWKIAAPERLRNGSQQVRCETIPVGLPGAVFEVVFQLAEESPIVRYRYSLRGDGSHRLTKVQGHDNFKCLGFSLADYTQRKEVGLSDFNQLFHSYMLSERLLQPCEFSNRAVFMGPILAAEGETHSLLIAYEHGSQAPGVFFQYELREDFRCELRAVKGTYLANHAITQDQPFESVWFQFGMVAGNEEALAKAYRQFVLHHQSQNTESRKPYIFYNTWAFQERNHHKNGKDYNDSMRQERILAEIDVAHRVGIEVFVLDNGWFANMGDWTVDLQRFPDGLEAVRAKLQAYGMKLGLWFSPRWAQETSAIFKQHSQSVMSMDGERRAPFMAWESEASQEMCLVSDYAKAFADRLIDLVRTLGVTYFKWDSVEQYGGLTCNDPNHHHGDASHSAQERLDCYAFRLPLALTDIVDRLGAACPEAIVDFDVTEGQRAFGLGFLSAGKYFLVNNGPYYRNYDLPDAVDKNDNMFFWPGPARGWICRGPLTFDKWLPSTLFLTHYLPDAPRDSQYINFGSLILGQNGIWGDLLSLSSEDIAFFGEAIRHYRQVREDITESSPVRIGEVGCNPEIHEKISERTGRGAVVIFASTAGVYEYVTRNAVTQEHWQDGGSVVSFDLAGHARIRATFNSPSARIILFGAV